MKTKLIILFAATLISTTLWAETGRSVMDRVDNLAEPKSLYSTMTMEIHKAGDVTTRKLETQAVKAGKNEKILLKITSPYSMKVLTHTNRSGDDLQWVKLRNGKVKQIASSDRKNPFENSHVFYEDLRSRNLDNFTYKLLGEANVNNTTCLRVRATPKPGKSIYDKADFYVIKSGEFKDFILMTDIYYKGYLYKRLFNYGLKKIDGIITPSKSVMFRLNKKGKNLGHTTLKLNSIKYNVDLPGSLFNSSGL